MQKSRFPFIRTELGGNQKSRFPFISTELGGKGMKKGGGETTTLPFKKNSIAYWPEFPEKQFDDKELLPD